jgi:type I restriction enzyme, S subunit
VSPKARIRDVATFIKGKKPSRVLERSESGALPYILIDSFDGEYRTFTDDSACVRCNVDDTLIVADGANTGRASIGHRGYVGSTLGILRPNKERIIPRYLFFFVHGAFGILNSQTRGAAVPHLERELLLSMELSLPRLAEQERIVRILDDADTLRLLRRRADEETASVIPAVFSELFLAIQAREHWPTDVIANLVAGTPGAIRTGPFGSQLLHSEFIEQGVRVLGIDNVVQNEFRWTSPRCVPPEKFERFKRFQVFPGDVLVTIMGTVGRCAVAPDDLPVCMSTKHLCVLTVDRRRLHPRYLWGSMLFDPEVGRQTGAIGSGAIMQGWNSTIIRELRLRVPPVKLQEKFAETVSELRALEGAQNHARMQVDRLFESVLSRAFQEKL